MRPVAIRHRFFVGTSVRGASSVFYGGSGETVSRLLGILKG